MITEESYRLIDAYFKGELNDADKAKFKELSKNVDFLTELEIQKELYDLHSNQMNQRFINSNDSDKYIKAIKTAEKAYFKKKNTSKLRRLLPYSIAASIVLGLFITIGFVLSNENSLPTYYAEYSDWNGLPSLIERTDDTSVLAEGEIAFKTKNYATAIRTFEIYLNQNPNNPQVLAYLGAAYLESGNETLAIKTFEQLANSNTLDSSRGLWYMALTYLKNGRKENSIKLLKQVIDNPNNYKSKEAKIILDAIAD